MSTGGVHDAASFSAPADVRTWALLEASAKTATIAGPASPTVPL
jgi:hypothetical protein